MDQTFFDSTAEKDRGMINPFFNLCFTEEDGQFFENLDRGLFTLLLHYDPVELTGCLNK
jgi:hypothetical protein